MKKGFTLIELLVVVAIIGVLATIITSSLGNARLKTKDASVVATLSSMRTQAELVYEGDFATFCDDSDSVYAKMSEAVVASGGSIHSCDHESKSYRVVAALPSSLASLRNVAYAAVEDGFCVNSLGTARKVERKAMRNIPAPACSSEEISNYYASYCILDREGCSFCLEQNPQTGLVSSNIVGNPDSAICEGMPSCTTNPFGYCGR